MYGQCDLERVRYGEFDDDPWPVEAGYISRAKVMAKGLAAVAAYGMSNKKATGIEGEKDAGKR